MKGETRFTVRHAALVSLCSDAWLGVFDTVMEPFLDNQDISAAMRDKWGLPTRNLSLRTCLEEKGRAGDGNQPPASLTGSKCLNRDFCGRRGSGTQGR